MNRLSRKKMRWPPFRHVLFDCDSTLTTIEGIDALAESLGKGWRVSVLTQAAMNGEVELEAIYDKRLRAVKPTRGQIQDVRRVYKQNIVADAPEVIAILQSLGHEVYIISGGLSDAVIDFGRFLGVPRTNIRAVQVDYDSLSGKWWQRIDDNPNVDEGYLTHAQVPLTISDGKALIIQELLAGKPGRSMLVGDGVSDLLAGHMVDLFVGFGGVVSRSRVKEESPVFVNSVSIAPILALASGPAIMRKKNEEMSDKSVLDRAAQLVADGAIEFKSEQLKTKFIEAWNASYSPLYPWPH